MFWTFSICWLKFYSFVLVLLADLFIPCKNSTLLTTELGEIAAMSLVLIRDSRITVEGLWLLGLGHIIANVAFVFTINEFILMKVF